jgi:succinyl-CoA synthetase alpha subunit
VDVGFGELLEALVHDPGTDGILLYVESVGDARAFMSALRMAARTKPVVVLKAGRSQERVPPIDAVGEPAISPDRVFDAALIERERCGYARTRSSSRRAHSRVGTHTAGRPACNRRQRPRARHARGGLRRGAGVRLAELA